LSLENVQVLQSLVALCIVFNMLVSINEVNRRRARLVRGWVSVETDKPSRPPKSTQSGHRFLAGAMSTGESQNIDRHTARCTRPASVVSECKLVSGWKLRKRRSASPYELVDLVELYVTYVISRLITSRVFTGSVY